MSYIEGESRNQALLFPEILDDCIPQDNLIRFLDAFVEGLGLEELGFSHSVPETTGRPPYDPRDLLKPGMACRFFYQRPAHSRRSTKHCLF
jgi:transposase